MPPPLILVAEDEETDVFILRAAFQKAALPVELVVVRDGREVVEYLSHAGQTPNPGYAVPGMMLLDLKMPRMGGFEVIEWLGNKPEFKQLPVVILTSSALEADLKKAREMGAREYLVKPHRVSELVELLRDIYQRYFPRELCPQPC